MTTGSFINKNKLNELKYLKEDKKGFKLESTMIAKFVNGHNGSNEVRIDFGYSIYGVLSRIARFHSISHRLNCLISSISGFD